ncbi:MAG: enoyl-CoA hydratase [Acidobacteria bacterium]|nr:enoyl-CoA hydratase [Acidobacteriota bacterium]
MYENITLVKENSIAWLTLNRPDKLNALVGTAREEILDALTSLEKDNNTKAICITGAGKGFCAGGDINYMASLQKDNDLEAFKKLLESGRQIVTKVRMLEKPVVAMINGVAAGAGLNLALASDIRIASSSARFSQAFIKIGLHPDWGGTFFLPRLIGTARACEMIFTGDVFDAETAYQFGLVNKVVSDNELQTKTQELLQKLVSRPSRALALAKRAIYQGIEHSLSQALDYETLAQRECFESENAKEGIQAFLERRDPKFK